MAVSFDLPIIPALLFLASIKTLLNSPQYLGSAGRFLRAREVLTHVRDGESSQVEQFLEICAVAKKGKPSSPLKVFWS